MVIAQAAAGIASGNGFGSAKDSRRVAPSADSAAPAAASTVASAASRPRSRNIRDISEDNEDEFERSANKRDSFR